MAEIPKDLTAVLYTADTIPYPFARQTLRRLKRSLDGLPLVIIHKGQEESSHMGIYRQALKGVKLASTKYVALCEDDVFYSPEHFKYRPSKGKFAYNLSAWSIFTWGEPIFHHKGKVRKNLNSLICERKLFIEAMEERFSKYPDGLNQDIWAEPGRYEKNLGVSVRETEEFFTNPPNIIFTHHNELSYKNLGTRKRIGEYRAYVIPYWGSAKSIRELYP